MVMVMDDGDTVSGQVQSTIAGSVDGNSEDGSGGCGYEGGGDVIGGCSCEIGGGGGGYECGGGVISIQIVSTFCKFCQEEAVDADGWVTAESDEDVQDTIVANPGFLNTGAPNCKVGISPENSMTMKEIGPKWGVPGTP